jgi:hypothetical protein
MNNQDLVEVLNKRIELYHQILKESDLDTTIFNEKQKERERKQRYFAEVDHFLGLKN